MLNKVVVNVFWYGGRFVVPTVGRTMDGLQIDGEPCAVADTVEGLLPLVQSAIKVGNPTVPQPVWGVDEEWTVASVVGAPSWAQFARKARLFSMAIGRDSCAVEELILPDSTRATAEAVLADTEPVRCAAFFVEHLSKQLENSGGTPSKGRSRGAK